MTAVFRCAEDQSHTGIHDTLEFLKFDSRDLQEAATFGPREIMQFEVISMSCLVESL